MPVRHLSLAWVGLFSTGCILQMLPYKGDEAPSGSDTAALPVSVEDTGSADTGSADTGSADTGSADTGSADTGSADTGSADTGSADTGTPEHPDTGEPICGSGA